MRHDVGVDHRPYAMPSGPWLIEQSWCEVLFAHWPLPVAAVRARVPAALELDLWEGQAWISAVAFRIDPFKTRWLPLSKRFPELNLRTYVRLGDRPGVYFFSLDAASRSAVMGGRTLFRLNYYDAAIQMEEDRSIAFTSRRIDTPRASFHARYRGIGEPAAAHAGSLDEWLVERYCLYAARARGRVFRVEIHHPPWRLQDCEATVDAESLILAAGLPMPHGSPRLHFSKKQDALTWGPTPVAGELKG